MKENLNGELSYVRPWHRMALFVVSLGGRGEGRGGSLFHCLAHAMVHE